MKIKSSVISQLVDHAKRETPIEACGYLAAREGTVTSLYALTNVDQSNEHFSFEPGEQFSALKDARANGLEIYAVYHSHPNSPARPSAEDIKLAFDPDKVYVIVSLGNGREDIKAYKIRGQEVGVEPLEVISDE